MEDQTRQMRRDALDIFKAGLAAVDPVLSINHCCSFKDPVLKIGNRLFDLNRFKKLMVIGAGKASAFMAEAIEGLLGDRITCGQIITKYGHGTPLKRISVSEAGHPIPDQNGLAAAETLIKLAQTADKHTLVICLISGGGSALTPLPVPGISLEDKQETTGLLVRCGATIHEINIIRRHLSRFKGGRLAKAAFPATMAALVISDVIGSDLSTIASGPAVADASTVKDCFNIITAYRIASQLPPNVIKHFNRLARGGYPETPKPGDPVFDKVFHKIAADNDAALRAARKKAQTLGYNCLIFSSSLNGDTRKAARLHADMAGQIMGDKANSFPDRPACILSGGETTVIVKGKGKGGRNMEFALACLPDIAGMAHTVILSCGTDGTDGPTDAAGAIVDHSGFLKAKRLKLDPASYLANNDSYHFFEKTGDLVKTGPTRTNVMDLKIVLCR